MYRLLIHQDAKADLEALRHTKSKAAARLVVLLEEIANDQDLLDRLTQHDFGAWRSADFHVSKWQEQWNQGKDLWRLKVWDLEDSGLRYRVVYAYQPGKRLYHVLGIVPREFNYEADHPTTQRILRAWQEL